MKRRRFALVAAFVFVVAACGDMGSSRSVPSQPGQFRLDEWSITADQPALRPGRQTITATNLGHLTHELVIVKANDAASLPTKSDGSADEDQLARVKVGEIADVPAGASRHKAFDLRPGSYVAFCNIVGGMGMGSDMMGGMEHVHFAAGMHTEFTVAA
jgi:hypothetical protein